MKPEERANIMKTLKELTEKITQLQNEMNPSPQVSSDKTPHNQPKTKTDVGFYVMVLNLANKLVDFHSCKLFILVKLLLISGFHVPGPQGP